MASQLEIAVSTNFDICQAVCSYGFFIQAPNCWDNQTRQFSRPLLGVNSNILSVTLRQVVSEDAVGRQALQVHTSSAATQEDMQLIKAQVIRMLRLSSQHVPRYQQLDVKAKQEGFGTVFRSPTVWEDLVKSILLCNCGWGRTLAMNRALCSNIGHEAFPTPHDVVEAGQNRLQTKCGLGYRAKSLLQLANQVLNGEVDLEKLDDSSMPEEELYALLLNLPGVGPFTAANMLQLLGHYSRIPCDSETVRHLRKAHGLHQCTQANVQQHADKLYAQYAPYQFLAYWRELWRDYEQLVGPFHLLHPDAYHLLTGHNMQKGIIPGRTAAGIAAVGAISSQIGTSADADRTSDKAPLSRAQTRSQTKTTQPTTVQTPSHTQAEQLQEDSGLGASAHEKHHGPHAHQEAQHAVVSATAQDNPWTHCSMHGLSADSHQQRPHLPQSPQQQNVKASEQDCIPGQSIQTPVPSLKANTAKALITNQKPETCAALPTAASTAKASVTVKKPTDKRRRIMPDQQQSKKSRRRGEHGKVPQ